MNINNEIPRDTCAPAIENVEQKIKREKKKNKKSFNTNIL